MHLLLCSTSLDWTRFFFVARAATACVRVRYRFQYPISWASPEVHPIKFTRRSNPFSECSVNLNACHVRNVLRSNVRRSGLTEIMVGPWSAHDVAPESKHQAYGRPRRMFMSWVSTIFYCTLSATTIPLFPSHPIPHIGLH